MADEPQIKMALPCVCPHCDKEIVIKFDIPAPQVTDVLTMEQLDEETKGLINEEENDINTEATTE